MSNAEERASSVAMGMPGVPSTAVAAPTGMTIAEACAAIAASLDLAVEGFSPPFPPLDVARAARRSLGLPDALPGSSVKANLTPICHYLGITTGWQLLPGETGSQAAHTTQGAVSSAAAATATALGLLDQSVEVAAARVTSAPKLAEMTPSPRRGEEEEKEEEEE